MMIDDDSFPDESHPPRRSLGLSRDGEFFFEQGIVRIPPHLLPIIREIAKRQRTTVEVVVAQAIADYCNQGF